MNMIGRTTRKRYYEDPYLTRCPAHVVRSGGDYIELDSTVAYPEGGGQESDRGLIHLPDGRRVRFVEAKRMYGYAPRLEGFPDIQVDGVIWHVIHPDDRSVAAGIKEGTPVGVEIDVERRARLTLSHTASHLVYVGIGLYRPDAIPGILGCHIKPEGARFDFKVAERFTPEDVEAITAFANDLVCRDAPVRVEPHAVHADARIWRCEAHQMPCGGTHLASTGSIGPLKVRRKCLGAGKERLSCEFVDAALDLMPYQRPDATVPPGADS
ncbi:MAG: alanyl-tRNA editing protein [Proteobacteria bacterium]|nr:alanyl-tRNA editing protein [Pseudomonadota bacterium]